MSNSRAMRNKVIVVSLLIIALIAVFVLLADQIVPFADDDMGDVRNAPPGTVEPSSGKIHWMGTDNLGQDIFTRVVHGTRITLVVGVSADALIMVIGISIGLISGYFGGIVDNLLMRFTDVMYAFPSLLFAMVVVAVLGQSILAVLIALGAANWVGTARLVRGQVLQVKQMDYVLSAYSLGARPLDIMRRHILPNILSAIIVLFTLTIPGIMTAEAALAFLGVGIDPSMPTLGKLIQAGRGTLPFYPTQALFPIATLALLTLAFTLLGDRLRDVLDPHFR